MILEVNERNVVSEAFSLKFLRAATVRCVSGGALCGVAWEGADTNSSTQTFGPASSIRSRHETRSRNSRLSQKVA